MKRSFSTLACMHASLNEVIDLARCHAMQGVELRCDNTLTLCGVPRENADTVKKAFAEADLEITDLACSVTITDYREEVLAHAKLCVETAHSVGARAIRVFLGRGGRRFSAPPAHDENGIIRTLRELCDYALQYHVEIWAETHSEFSACREMRRIVDAVDRENLRILWDVIHSMEYRESFADSISALDGKLVHVHLKDGVYSGDPDCTQYIHCALGKGEMPFPDVLCALADIGYDGYLSLEWEAPWRPELANCYPDNDMLLSEYNRVLDEALMEDSEGAWFPPVL